MFHCSYSVVVARKYLVSDHGGPSNFSERNQKFKRKASLDIPKPNSKPFD